MPPRSVIFLFCCCRHRVPRPEDAEGGNGHASRTPWRQKNTNLMWLETQQPPVLVCVLYALPSKLPFVLSYRATNVIMVCLLMVFCLKEKETRNGCGQEEALRGYAFYFSGGTLVNFPGWCVLRIRTAIGVHAVGGRRKSPRRRVIDPAGRRGGNNGGRGCKTRRSAALVGWVSKYVFLIRPKYFLFRDALKNVMCLPCALKGIMCVYFGASVPTVVLLHTGSWDGNETS